MLISDADKTAAILGAVCTGLSAALVYMVRMVARKLPSQSAPHPQPAPSGDTWQHRRANDFTQGDRELVTDLMVTATRQAGKMETLTEKVGELTGRVIVLTESVDDLVRECATDRKIAADRKSRAP